MNGDDLRLAPAGASDAACAVCLHMTFNRIQPNSHVETTGATPVAASCPKCQSIQVVKLRGMNWSVFHCQSCGHEWNGRK